MCVIIGDHRKVFQSVMNKWPFSFPIFYFVEKGNLQETLDKTFCVALCI